MGDTKWMTVPIWSTGHNLLTPELKHGKHLTQNLTSNGLSLKESTGLSEAVSLNR